MVAPEDHRVLAIIQALAEEFVSVPFSTLAELVEQAWDRYRDARIRDYVPALVLHDVQQRLRANRHVVDLRGNTRVRSNLDPRVATDLRADADLRDSIDLRDRIDLRDSQAPSPGPGQTRPPARA